MSRFTKIIVATLAVLAIAAPVASAMPIRESGGTSSQQLPGPPTWPVDPEPIGSPASADAAPSSGADGSSALVYILPGAIMAVLLAAGATYTVRASARRARAGA